MDNGIASIGNAIFGILNAQKEQQQQGAMFDIIKQALTPTTETQGRGANPAEILNYISQYNGQSAGPAPMPDIPMGTPPAMNLQPSFMGGIPNPAEPQFQPKFQTVGDTSGAMNASEIDPAALGQQLGLTQEMTKQKSALQMYQTMLNHPLFNQLQPGQAQNLISTITGIQKMMPQPVQQDPYTLSPGQQRFDGNGNQISAVPANPESDYQLQQIDLQNRRADMADKVTGIAQQRADLAQQIAGTNDVATQRRLDQQDKTLEIREKQLGEYIKLSDSRISELKNKGGSNGSVSGDYQSELQRYYTDSQNPGFNDTVRKKWSDYLLTKFPGKSTEINRIVKLPAGNKSGANAWDTAPGGAPAGQPAGMVRVKGPDGKTGSLPAANLKAALAAGYTQIK